MATAAYNNETVIDGAGELIVKDETSTPATVKTHAEDASTPTVIKVASDPAAVGMRPGDVVQIGANGTEARRVTAITAASITLEEPLTDAPGAGVDIIRCGIHLGYTTDGIMLTTKTTYAETMADQALAPINIKPDKVEANLKTTLMEVFGASIRAALSADPSCVEVAGGTTRIKMGNRSMTLTTFGFLALGGNVGGDKVSVFAPKGVNQGEVGIGFSKGAATGLGLDIKLMNDARRPAGEELWTTVIGAKHDYSFLLRSAA